MLLEKDFAQAEMNLKLSKINGNEPNTEYNLYFSRQKYHDDDKHPESFWFCLVERDEDGGNVTQFDFDDISKKDVVNMIKQMINVLKADLK